VVAGLDDLGQDAAGRARVQEGDEAVADPDPRLRVDQLDAGRGELLEGRLDVLDGVGDVMEAGALAGEELADRGVLAERAEELDVTVADVEQNRFDALLGDRLAVDERHAEDLFLELDGGVEVIDGDAGVVDPVEHRRGFY
jgi:hypothetical protein